MNEKNPKHVAAGSKGGTTTRDRYGVEQLSQKAKAASKKAGRPTFYEAIAWIRAQGHEVKLSRASVKRLLAEGHCPNCGVKFGEIEEQQAE